MTLDYCHKLPKYGKGGQRVDRVGFSCKRRLEPVGRGGRIWCWVVYSVIVARRFGEMYGNSNSFDGSMKTIPHPLANL